MQKQETKIKKKRHLLRKITISIFVLWAIVELVFLLIATPILKNKLKEIVKRESKGVYTIDFDYISVEPISVSFKLINFSLSADTAKYNYLKNTSNVRAALYEISFESLSLRTLHLVKLFRKDEIEFKKIEINKPIVNILALPKSREDDTIKYDAVHEDLYSTIKPYAKSLNVKNVILNYGHFNLQLNHDDNASKSVAEEITVNLYNFKLDSIVYYKKSNLFYSDSLTFVLKNYKLKLNDGIHNVFAAETKISLADSTITVINAHIFPDSLGMKKNPNKSFYDIKTPKVKFTGADIHNAWFNKDISIKKIEFDSAKIVIISPESKNDTAFTVKNIETDYRNIYPLIAGRLKSVSVEDFSFSNASFEFRKGIINKPMYTIKKLNLSLRNFGLDSLAYNKKDKILYADNFEMDVSDYHMKISDNTHEIFADQLYLSTEKKVIFAVNLNMLPLKEKAAKISLNIKIPFFRINDADFIKAYNTGELNIGELISDNPKIKIQKIIHGKKKNAPNVNIIYNIVSEYLSKVTIDKLSLEHGNLSFSDILDQEKQAFINGNISLHLRDFLLDENTATRTDRVFYASGFDLILNNLSMKSVKDLHLFKAKKIRASTIKSILEIEGLEYKPINDTLEVSLLKKYKKQTLKYFSIDKLLFSNVDIKRALFKKILTIKKIYMKRPKLSIKKYAGLVNKNNVKNPQDSSILFKPDSTLSDNKLVEDTVFIDSVKTFRQIVKDVFSDRLNEISVNFFKVDSGYIDVSNLDSLKRLKSYFKSNITAKVDSFYFNKDSIYEDEPVFAGNTKIFFSNFNVLFPNKFHKINIKNITYLNTDSSLTANYIRVFPDISFIENKILREFMFFSKHIKISGIDIENALNKKGFNINDLTIERPYISIGFNKELINETVKDKIAKEFKLKPVNIKNINIHNGILELSTIKDSIDNIFFNTEFDIYAKNMRTDSTLDVKKSLPLFDSSKITLKKLEILMPDGNYALNLDSINFNIAKSKTKIYNLIYYVRDDINIFDYFKNRSNQTSLNFSIEQVDIDKIDIYKLLFKKKLFINQISLMSPYFLIEKYKNAKKEDKNKLSVIENKIKNILTKSFEQVYIHKLYFSDTKVKYIARAPKYKVTEISQISGEITDFDVSKKESNNKNNLLFASDISLNIRNYFYDFSEKYYKLNIKNIAFSTKKAQITIDSLNYLPIIDKYKYARKAGKQMSVIFIKNADAIIQNFDFLKFFTNESFSANKIILNRFNMYIFKDMHLPEDTLKRPVEPWLLLKNINPQINFAEIEIKNSKISYEQNSPKHELTGLLEISDINGNITNVTNDTSAINKNKYMQMKLKAKLQKEANLRVSFRFPLDDRTGSYSFAGTADTFNIKILNSFVENTSFVSIKNGTVNKVDFYVDVNEKYASGKMHLFYNNLGVSIIDTSSSSKGFYTFVANSVLPRSNPKNKYGKIREGKIYYEKVAYKSVFSLWTKSILSGASYTLGFKSKQMKKHLKFTKRLSRFIEKEKRQKEKASKDKLKEMKKDIE